MTLPSPAPVPPILRLFELLTSIPSLLGIGRVPVTFVPMTISLDEGVVAGTEQDGLLGVPGNDVALAGGRCRRR